MINRFFLRMLLGLLAGRLALCPCRAQSDASSNAPAPAVSEASEPAAKVFHPIKPAPYDGRIAFATAVMLTNSQFLRKPFDAQLSSKFLDRYLETFDPQHVHFLQADLAEFERYRTNLDRLTLRLDRQTARRTGADTEPACEIFNRFMERFQQHVSYVEEMLKSNSFSFDQDERIVVNRKDLPYPKDLDEAKVLWRERLRAEYLSERLGLRDAKKKTDKPAKTGAPIEPAAKSATASADKPAAEKPKSEAEQIVETLARRYHRLLKSYGELEDEDVLGIYLTTLSHVYDPHTDFMTPSQLENFSIQMNLSLFGIGAELGSEDGYCTIRRLLEGGPAAASKQFNVGDRIVAVAQSNAAPVDLVEMRLDKAVQLIRGPKGTMVRLWTMPGAKDATARKEITLIRDEIPLEAQETKGKVIDLPDTHNGNVRLGVIDLPSFYAPFDPTNLRGKSEAKTPSIDIRRFLTKFKQEHVSGVILDLRRNGGGSLEEAIRVTGLFIREGPVVQVKNFNGSVEPEDDPDPAVYYDGPLLVLTSKGSASASEILAGALQDYGRALIIGDNSTFGKGSVQTVVPVANFYPRFVGAAPPTNELGALKITIKKFYRPSGASTELNGVVPDIILPSVMGEMKEIGEGSLDNPLDRDTVATAKYDHLNCVAPYLPELRKRSAQRVAADPEYAYIREDIELYKKNQADKTLSLNEKERLKQKAEDDTRREARKKERLARKEPQEVVRELTLKQLDQPGLPAPKTNSIAKLSTTQPAAESEQATNLSASATDSAGPDALTADLDDDPAPVDAALKEAENVLLDYLFLLPKDGLAAAVRASE